MEAKKEIERLKVKTLMRIGTYESQLRDKLEQIKALDFSSAGDVRLNLLFDCIRITCMARQVCSERLAVFSIDRELEEDKLLE